MSPHPTGPPSAVPLVAVVGATASGKTGLSLDLAERLGGEVVNTDAMQVYRGMDIGTAKLPVAERRGIAHHLLDTHDVTRDRDRGAVPGAGRARSIADLRARADGAGPGRRLRALHPGDRGPLRVPGHRRGRPVRARGRAGARSARRRCTRGCAPLDPEAAARILLENGRRMVRALEVIEITGRPYSASLPHLEYADPRTVQLGVDIDRPTLDARIERRVERDVRPGLRRRGRAAAGRPGWPRGVTASRAIGYREVAAYLARRAHPRRGAGAHRRRRPAASPGARTGGSARTRGSSGSGTTTRPTGDRARAVRALGEGSTG